MSGRVTTADALALPLIEGRVSPGSLNDRIAGAPARRFGRIWLAALGVALLAAAGGLASAAWLLARGVGVWGVNVPVGWGFAIVNFVWWIGIGHAGTLISAILLLLRQPWRNSINRFAEAMTLFAVANAAIFPLLHLGRVWKLHYLLPYPNQMSVWPQWRSPLVWDAFAVATYGLVSLLFWGLGLMPDLATMRDEARAPWARRLCALGALGWRNEARQWAALRRGYLITAGLATALVVSVHSIVSLDFAVSVVPGWTPTVFPPYFVAGAIFSGMAMVLTIGVPLRRAFRLHDLITTRHLDLMAKVMLVSGLIVAYGYFSELFTEALASEPAERHRLYARLAGHGAIPFWITIGCNVVAAQLLWLRRVRTGPWLLFVVSLVINVGMWMERYGIVVTSLERDYIPSAWGAYTPTLHDWALFLGTIGLFVAMFLLFVRLLPVSPIYELKELAQHEGRLDEPRSAPEPVLAPAGAAPPCALEFDSLETARRAAERLRAAGARLDIHSPYPDDELSRAVGGAGDGIARWFLLGGLAGGGGAYALQFFSAVVDYPWLVAGKPLHSWPSFVPITYEVTILAAAVCGLVATLRACGLPRLHHPCFDIPGFERASRDRFFIVVRSGSSLALPPIGSLAALRVIPLAKEPA